jgi:tetratricopeptide (TPR) repeat protein
MTILISSHIEFQVSLSLKQMINHFLHKLTATRFKKTISWKLLILSLILGCNSSPPLDNNTRMAKVKAKEVIKASFELSQRYGWTEYSIGLLNHASKSDPNNSFLFKFNIGLNYQEIKQFDKAISHYQETIKLNPNFAKPHFYMGNILLEKKMFNEGISHLKSAIEIYTDKLQKIIFTNAIDGRGYEMSVKRANAFGNIGLAGDLMKDMKTAITYTHKAIDAYSKTNNLSKLDVKNFKFLEKTFGKMLQKYNLKADKDKDGNLIVTPQNPSPPPIALNK